MSTTLPNPPTTTSVRTRPGRVLAGAGALVAAVACAIAFGQATGPGAEPASDQSEISRPDPAILHHHWLNTAEPVDAAERMSQAADRFHHR